MSQTEPPDETPAGSNPPSGGPPAAQPEGGPSAPLEDQPIVPASATPVAPDAPVDVQPDSPAQPAPAAPGIDGWAAPGDAAAAPGPGQSPRGGLLRKLAIPAIILVVVVGGIVFRDRLSGSSGDLAVGDCFDAPSSANAPATGVEIGDVQHHPCTEPHGFEAFAVLTHPAARGDPYPGIEVLFSYAETNCLPAFGTYVGIDYQESSLGAASIVPQEKGWTSGDRTITCYVGSADESPVTGSLKGSQK